MVKSIKFIAPGVALVILGGASALLGFKELALVSTCGLLLTAVCAAASPA